MYLANTADSSQSEEKRRSVRPQVLDYFKIAKCKILILCMGAAAANKYSTKPSSTNTISSEELLTDSGFTSAMRLIHAERRLAPQKRKVIIESSCD